MLRPLDLFLTNVLVDFPVNTGPRLCFVSLSLDDEFVMKGAIYCMVGVSPVFIYLKMFSQTAQFRNFLFSIATRVVVLVSCRLANRFG